MSLIVKAGKAGKRVLKAAHILPEEAPHVSYTRRIERVRTPERVCAMTFDDGPMDLPAAPDQFHGRALTDLILDALAEFDAKGTFDVIGDTSMNYPDEAGKEGSAAWGGVRYDHYPDIHQDEYGGVVHNDRLIRRMLAEGHQITNHGYRHILFGKKSFVYGKRVHYGSVHSAVGDLRRLDQWMRDNYNYLMSMGRPPHYVDGLNGGFTSYDVYDRMGYQYLAASFDGAGWLPSGKKDREALEAEIVAMTNPIREALEKDPDFFCGQIIFQKDGYNMARRTPVAWGLPLQLEILHQYGYQVVTVAELMEECPFADIDREHPLFDKMARLAKRRGVAYSDNKLRLEDHMTMGELAMLLAPIDEALDLRWAKMRRTKRRAHPYYGALAWCSRERILPRNANPDAPVTELPFGIFDSTKTFTRRAVYEAFREDWLDQGEHQEEEIRKIEERLRGWVVPPLPPAPDLPPVPGTPDEAEAVENTETPEEAQAVADTETPEEAAETVADRETPDETAEAVADTETPEEAAEAVADTETPQETAKAVADTETPQEAAEAVADMETPQEMAEAVAATDAPQETAEAVADAETPDEAAEAVIETETPEETAQAVADTDAPEEAEAVADTETPEEMAQAVAETETPEETAQAVAETETPQEAAQAVAPEAVPQVVVTQEPHIETAEEVYVHALEEVYTEDSGDAHKIMNLPHVENIPHVDGIPVMEPQQPDNLSDLFPEDTDDET